MSDTPDEPRLRHVQCLDGRGLHRMAYWDWARTGDRGAAHDRVLVCVHGLSRQGRDFDTLARALRDGWRVVCPDVVGRGESDRLADPAGYQIQGYVADMVTLLARLDAKSVHWVGTSMGGLIGMVLAALPGSPIESLVLNDIGPAIDAEGIARIAAYVGQPLTWANEDDAAAYLLTISQGFGVHSREQWLALTRPMLRRDGERWRLHYDPAIAVALRAVTPAAAAAGEAALWAAYDTVRCPTLVLRGTDSDVLSPATAGAMRERGPRAVLHEFAGVGHAPMLVAPEQIAVVREFLPAGR
ncbi:MAG: alpha/beta hydrolase [Caldimonas sp.]